MQSKKAAHSIYRMFSSYVFCLFGVSVISYFGFEEGILVLVVLRFILSRQIISNGTTAQLIFAFHCFALIHLLDVRFLYEPHREKIGFLHMRKQRRRRGNREADQRLCFRDLDSMIPLISKSKIFKALTIFCDCTARFISDLVGNPEDRFSQNEAQL